MRSRYENDQNHPESWPGEKWLTDWWHGLTSPRRWAAGAGVVLAVVLAFTGVAAAGGFASHGPATAGRAPAPVRQGPAAEGLASAAQGGAPAAVRAAPVRAGHHGARSAAKRGGPLRTSCQTVAHIGDSTSVDLLSPVSVPSPAQRLGAQYRDVGVRHLHIDASGGRSVVEEMPGQINGYKVASSYWAHGYRGCWVFALGTNDVADVQAGSAIGLTARIDQMMSAAHGEPVLWVNTRTELSAGPWADAGEQAWDAALAQALKTYPNLRIFNWSAVAQPSWFLGDGIHYNTTGCAFRAHDIAAALARAFPAAGHSASRIVT
jgi:hypothetical protein